ncbi:MAG: polyprenyl synthetase family protein [Gammaproteobacteria bacterium]|jgi:geranylgeranyl pyrophosphate synthase
MPSSLIASTLEQTIRRYGEDANALTVAAKHHFSRPGKRTRAKLLFAASSHTKNSQALMHVAAAVELIHEASIVHDDIQDRTQYRRGNKTVWQKFGANTALLLGDHLVASAFKAIAEAPGVDSIRGALITTLSASVSRAASGQHLQLTNRAAGDFWSFYYDVAINKTGALIALPLQLAMLLERGQCSSVASAARCGEQLGLAYQILDDLKPYTTPENLASHEDFVNGVITAPVAACHELFSRKDPFQSLVDHPDRRQLAVRLCQRWLNEALMHARHSAALLPEPCKSVVDAFIRQQLTPAPVTASQPSPFKPWREQQAEAARVEAV